MAERQKVAPLLPGNMQISTSQLGSFESCERQWWFSYVIRLPVVKRDYFAFGTVLHGCIERWLSAVNLGRVPSRVPVALKGQTPGAAVELFPEGWETVAEKGKVQKLSPKECAVIRNLMREAIERGIIDRHELLGVELFIQVQVIDGVELYGYVDIVKLDGIHDHKSFAAGSVPYLKRDGPKLPSGQPLLIDAPYTEGDGTSPNCVGHDSQLLTYAYVLFRHEKNDPRPVRLRHNQYPKDAADAKGARFVEAWVSPRRLERHWETVKAAAARMKALRQITNESDWTKVPGPLESAKRDAQACSAYGGCPFRLICAKQELPGQHRLRVNSLLGKPQTQTQPQLPTPMPLFKTYTGAAGAVAAPPAQAPAVPVNGAQPSAAPAPIKPSYEGVPVTPWANPECKACAGTGQNIEKGRPCTACEALASKAGRPTPDQFDLAVYPNGQLQWTPKATAAPVPLPQATPAAQPAPASSALAPAGRPTLPSRKGKKKDEAPVPAPVASPLAAAAIAPAAAPAPAPVAAPAAPVAPVQADEPAEPSNPRGRPKVGLVLRLGCNIIKGPAGRKMMTIQDVLAFVGAQLAQSKGVESYYAIQAFERRDLIAAHAQAIADELGSVVVVGNISCPDTKALYGALLTVSNDVTEGAVG